VRCRRLTVILAARRTRFLWRDSALAKCIPIIHRSASVVVQARGFANWRASADEFTVIERTAAEQDLTCSTWLREEEFGNEVVA
jgi:hypothetical protein